MPRACARSMIVDRLRLQLARPAGRAGASLPPSATISTRTSPSSAQSSRLRPPADVSPDTPAFTTSIVQPGGIEPLLQQRRDTPALVGRPRPAVRLSPSTTIRGRVSAAGAGVRRRRAGRTARPADRSASARSRRRDAAAPRPTHDAQRQSDRRRRRQRRRIIRSAAELRSSTAASSAAIACSSIRRCAGDAARAPARLARASARARAFDAVDASSRSCGGRARRAGVALHAFGSRPAGTRRPCSRSPRGHDVSILPSCSAHDLLTRWPALDVAARRARLQNAAHLPGPSEALTAQPPRRARRRPVAPRPVGLERRSGGAAERSPIGSAGSTRRALMADSLDRLRDVRRRRSSATASPTSCCSAWAARAWRRKCCAR